MRWLPLYAEIPKTPIEVSERLDLDPSCGRCKLSAGKLYTRCIPDQGEPGGILFVGEGPGENEDRQGKPFVGNAGALLKETIRQSGYEGPIALANATRCKPQPKGAPKTEVDAKAVEACRPFLAGTLDSCRPSRIVCLGAWATLSVLGRKLGPLSVRRGHGWLHTLGIPVFMVLHPSAGLRNEILKKWFKDDLKWAIHAQPAPADLEVLTSLVETREDAVFACNVLREFGFTYDVETSGRLYDSLFHMVALSATARGTNRTFTWSEDALNDDATAGPLRELLADHDVIRHFQNGKFDMAAVRCHFGIEPELREIGIDTRYTRKLQFADADADLATMAELVGMGGHKLEAKVAIDEARKELRKGLFSAKQFEKFISELPERMQIAYRLSPDEKAAIGNIKHMLPTHAEDLTPKARSMVTKLLVKLGDESSAYAYAFIKKPVLHAYNARDSLSTDKLVGEFESRFEKDNPAIRRVWDTLSKPALWAYEQIEAWGIKVDREKLHAFDVYCASQIDSTWERLKKYGDFNPNSPAQVSKILYQDLGLKPLKVTGGGAPSTDKDTLTLLASLTGHPFPTDLLVFRKFGKLRGTYALGMLPIIRTDGRVHPNFNVDGARSGRTSCDDPNMQNIPRSSTPEGKMARDVYVPDRGNIFVQADFSQLELRVAAAVTGDPLMIDIFAKGDDYHLRTAKLIAKQAWGIQPDEVGDFHRSQSKTITFGLLYGMSDYGLAYRLKVSPEEAESLRVAILGKFKVLDQWIRKVIAQTTRSGEVWTEWDGQPARRRPLYRVQDQDQASKINAQNAAVNCLDFETEALTKRGWLRGPELTLKDELLTKSPKTGLLEWRRPTDLMVFPTYDGPLIEFRSKSFHAVTTPQHRWLITKNRTNEVTETTSDKISLYGDDRIHRTGIYQCAASEFESDIVELAGWWLTDGYVKKTRRVEGREGLRGPKSKGTKFGLCQSERAKPHHVARIDALLQRIGIKPSRRLIERTQCVYWEFFCPALERVRKLCPNRTLTMDFLTRIAAIQAQVLLGTMLDGDGHRGTKTTFVCRAREGAEAFQVLATLCGVASSIVKRDMAKYTPRSDKLTNIPRGKAHYQVTLLRRDKAQVTKKQVHHFMATSGVWCPVVPNTFFVARRSGHVYITGNTPIQGQASDYCLASAYEMVKWIKEERINAKLILTVHDSILIECPEDMKWDIKRKMQQVMTSWPCKGVPLVVDSEFGYGWGSMQKIKTSKCGWEGTKHDMDCLVPDGDRLCPTCGEVLIKAAKK